MFCTRYGNCSCIITIINSYTSVSQVCTQVSNTNDFESKNIILIRYCNNPKTPMDKHSHKQLQYSLALDANKYSAIESKCNSFLIPSTIELEHDTEGMHFSTLVSTLNNIHVVNRYFISTN